MMTCYLIPVYEDGVRDIEDQLEIVTDKGVVRLSFSSWSLPVVLVTKKNGEVRPYFCVDNRHLDKVNVKVLCPLPGIAHAAGAIGGCCCSSLWVLADTCQRKEDCCRNSLCYTPWDLRFQHDAICLVQHTCHF